MRPDASRTSAAGASSMRSTKDRVRSCSRTWLHQRRQVVDDPVQAIELEIGTEATVLDADMATGIDDPRDLPCEPPEPVEDRLERIPVNRSHIQHV